MSRLRGIIDRCGNFVRTLRLRELAFAPRRCPLCGPSVLLRLSKSEMGVRCLRCGGSAVHLSLGQVALAECGGIAEASVYELSARGAWVAFLKRRVRNCTFSEYAGDGDAAVLPAGVRDENVEHLGFADASFDLVTCTDVFEHVADDRAGFAEVLRVLRPGGKFVFTIPLGADSAMTVERAVRTSTGDVEHLLPAEFHGDHLRGAARVLVFRDYAGDVVGRLRTAGFVDAKIVCLPAEWWWGLARPVIVAGKPERNE